MNIENAKIEMPQTMEDRLSVLEDKMGKIQGRVDDLSGYIFGEPTVKTGTINAAVLQSRTKGVVDRLKDLIAVTTAASDQLDALIRQTQSATATDV